MEAAGLATTAALATHAFDRPGPTAAVAPDHPAHCLNCGATLTGPYCHECGQKAHLHRSIGHIFEELVHGVLHWDSKGWRTLPMLVANPGRLTRDYVEGKRARHIAPLSLFLALFLVMFIGFSFLGPSFDASGVSAAAANEAADDIAAELARARADPATPRATILTLETALANAQAVRARAAGTPAATGNRSPVSEQIRAASTHAVVEFNGKRYEGLTKKVQAALANPEFTFYRFKQKAFKLSFLLVPLSIPVVWILFAGRRGVHLYDHAVFVLYSLSFMSLLVIALLLAGKLGKSVDNVLDPLALLVPGAHMFAQLKGAYQLSWSGAAWRTALLLIGSVMVGLVYLLLMLILGLLD